MSLLRIAFAAAGLLALAACGSGELPTTTPEPSGAQSIVFVGPRFDVWTVRSDGSGAQRVIGGGSVSPESGTNVAFRAQQAQNVSYTWPTWSPDGRFAAISRTPGIGGNSVAGLVLLDAETSAERQVHRTQQGSIGFVANGAPHYALWAPTSESLSFVAPRGPGLGLGLFSVGVDDDEPYEIATDAPLYHVWSPDGRYVLVHRRAQLLLHDTGNRSTRDLDADSFRYRVPAFSPDGERIAYVVEEGGAGRLVTSKLDGTDRVPVMHVPGVAAFAWSPDGGRIAVAVRPLSRPSHDALYVVNEDGTGAEEPLVSGSIAAFYWSPDGSRLAYVTIADRMAWEVADRATRETRLLTPFVPTPDFLTHLQFFDQFAPSHQVWSADSTQLAFAGVIDTSENPGVWIVDAAGNEPPRPIAEGRLAFWVPSPGE